MTTRCCWTGQLLTSARPGQRFVSAAAKNEAHTVARKYAEHLIAEGLLSWDVLRAWADRSKSAGTLPCTDDVAQQRPDRPQDG